MYNLHVICLRTKQCPQRRQKVYDFSYSHLKYTKYHFFILSSSLVYEKSYTLGQIDFTTSLLLLVKYMSFHTLQNNCQMKLFQN